MAKKIQPRTISALHGAMEPDMVKFIKRINEERVHLLNTNPDGNRQPGRPKTRWKDAVELDLKALRVSDWKTLAQKKRSDWRRMLDEAKTNDRL